MYMYILHIVFLHNLITFIEKSVQFKERKCNTKINDKESFFFWSSAV